MTQDPQHSTDTLRRRERGRTARPGEREAPTHAVDATFESLLEAAPDAMVGVDPTGTIMFANARAERLFGYPRGELLGSPLDLLVPEPFHELHRRQAEQYFGQPVDRPMGSGLDLSAKKKDGTVFAADISLSVIETAQGPIAAAAVRDVTEQRWREEQLQLVAAMIDSSQDAIFSETLDRTIMTWNPAATRLFGYTEAEAKGMNAADLIPPGHRDDGRGIVERVARGEPVPHTETKRVTKDGRLVDVAFSAAPIRDRRGVTLGVVAIARDITESKRQDEIIRSLNADLERRVETRTAELAEAVEELQSFSYSVAHDLRAPLRAIDGFSRIMLEEYGGRLDAEGQRLLAVIRGNTSDMGRLIDDLLTFSRLARQPLHLVPVDMTALATDVVRELEQATYRERDVRTTIAMLPAVRGDHTLIRLLFVNLISNALKFSEPRGIADITIEGEHVGAECRYQVRDNGIGFDMAYADKLFQVFQRLEPDEFEGTGVGLAIVARIVRRQGGRVWAEGRPGQGATFGFALPADGQEQPRGR